MDEQQYFVNIGTVLFAVDQVMSIGILDDFKSIRVTLKNPAFEPVVINFTSEDAAESCFSEAKDALAILGVKL